MTSEEKNIFRKLYDMPVQVIYLALLLCIILPSAVPIGFPITISEMTRAAYNAIESLPRGSSVIYDFSISPSGYVEIGPAGIATAAHLFMRDTKVLYVATTADGVMSVIAFVKPLAESMGKKYGEDWVLLGYVAGRDTGIASLLRDTHSIAANDYFGNKIVELPLMNAVRSGRDVKLAVCATGDADVSVGWVRQGVTPYGMLYIDIPTGVIFPTCVPFFPKQMVGIINSLRGGAEYELLLRRPGMGISNMDIISTTHLLLVVLIILGNVGYFAARRRGAK